MSEESSRTHDVFLSYSSKDKTWADSACAVLEQHRVRCWIAPRDMTPGDEWAAGIIKGLNASRIMVLIFSDHANASKQVRKEVERAISKDLPVLAFRIQNVAPKDAMEFNLSNIHWLDAFTPPVERQLQELARSVKTLLASDPKLPEDPRDTGDMHTKTIVDVHPARRPPWMRRSAVLGVLVLGLLGAWLGSVFKAKMLDGVVEVDNVPKDSDSAGTKPTNETALGRDKTVPPIAATAPRSDQERIQGRWQTVEAVNGTDIAKGTAHTNERADRLKFIWEFQGKHLTIHMSDPEMDDRAWRGSFSLSASVERKLFDFVGTSPAGIPLELLGIYELEGESLKFCYGIRRDQNDSNVKRPDSFDVLPGTNRHYWRFRRLGDG
jgi:uncharacterized protein (TIGR03067 family)